MSSALRPFEPDLLLDWEKLFAGDMVDDRSGLTWSMAGTFAPDAALLGGIGGKFTGSNYLSISGIPAAAEYWTAITMVRCDAYIDWSRIFESATASSTDAGDMIGLMTGPNGFGGAGRIASGHVTTPSGGGWGTIAGIPDWQLGAGMLSLIRRGSVLEAWYGGRIAGTCTVGNSSVLPRTLYVGTEHRRANVMWRGAIGDVGWWHRALSSTEMGAIYSSVMTASTVVMLSGLKSINVSRPASYEGIDHLSVRHARADGLAGPGSIIGTVKINNRPVSRLVRCWDHATATLMAETWSDPVTGLYRFDGLALDRLYFLASHDHEREYNAAVADYRYAEVLS